MDESILRQALAETFIEGWEVTPTGSGFLVISDWRWPNRERIEIFVRTVGERDDLYTVTDGGDLFNFLFAQGIDLTQDEPSLRTIQGTAKNYGAEFIDYQLLKGANDEDLAQAIRELLEAIKDASLLLWYKLESHHSVH